MHTKPLKLEDKEGRNKKTQSTPLLKTFTMFFFSWRMI